MWIMSVRYLTVVLQLTDVLQPIQKAPRPSSTGEGLGLGTPPFAGFPGTLTWNPAVPAKFQTCWKNDVISFIKALLPGRIAARLSLKFSVI